MKRPRLRSAIVTLTCGLVFAASTTAPGYAGVDPVDELGEPLPSAAQGLPVPSTATEDATRSTPSRSGLLLYRVPRDTPFRALAQWYKENVPFGQDRLGGWGWCAESSTTSTRRGDIPQWSWDRPSVDGMTTDSLVLTIIRDEDRPKKADGIVLGVVYDDLPCDFSGSGDDARKTGGWYGYNPLEEP